MESLKPIPKKRSCVKSDQPTVPERTNKAIAPTQWYISQTTNQGRVLPLERDSSSSSQEVKDKKPIPKKRSIGKTDQAILPEVLETPEIPTSLQEITDEAMTPQNGPSLPETNHPTGIPKGGESGSSVPEVESGPLRSIMSFLKRDKPTVPELLDIPNTLVSLQDRTTRAMAEYKQDIGRYENECEIARNEMRQRKDDMIKMLDEKEKQLLSELKLREENYKENMDKYKEITRNISQVQAQVRETSLEELEIVPQLLKDIRVFKKDVESIEKRRNRMETVAFIPAQLSVALGDLCITDTQ